MTTLTNADKAQIINSRLKNLLYLKYNLDVDKIVENAKSVPVASVIEKYNDSISEVNLQISALTTELAKYPVEEA
jgi:hypothetical protein